MAIDYIDLYAKQDAILNFMKTSDTSFYLTGGTCLHRFFQQQRYSDDLDFFCSENNLFSDFCREITEASKDKNIVLETVIDTRDFKRYKFENLKIDFVNDRVHRHGRTELSPEGYNIDNIINILTNKITAIVGRDEAKDVFDICTIAENYKFNWPEIIEIAMKKNHFEQEFLLYRLRTFPKPFLEQINIIEEALDKTDVNKNLPVIIEDIVAKRDNQLC